MSKRSQSCKVCRFTDENNYCNSFLLQGLAKSNTGRMEGAEILLDNVHHSVDLPKFEEFCECNDKIQTISMN